MRLKIKVALVVLGLLLGASPAVATDCLALKTIDDHYQAAGAVFYGKVTTVTTMKQRGPGNYVVQMTLERVWKVFAPREVTFSVPVQFNPGEIWIIFTQVNGEGVKEHTVSPCGKSVMLGPSGFPAEYSTSLLKYGHWIYNDKGKVTRFEPPKP